MIGTLFLILQLSLKWASTLRNRPDVLRKLPACLNADQASPHAFSQKALSDFPGMDPCAVTQGLVMPGLCRRGKLEVSRVRLWSGLPRYFTFRARAVSTDGSGHASILRFMLKRVRD